MRRRRGRGGGAVAAVLAAALVVVGAHAAPAPVAARSAAPDPLALLALQQVRVTSAQSAAYARLGCAVALDGDTALVGAEGKTAAGQPYAGAVQVVTRSGGAWYVQTELTAPQPAAGDGFGCAVALDGDTALIGASGRGAGGAPRAGAVYVFVRANGGWTLQAELTAADPAVDDWLGSSVALDGDTAVAGAPGRSMGGVPYAGAAYVFRRSGGVWSPEAVLAAGDSAFGDRFGSAVALDGDTALVGVENRTVAGAAQAGQAFVFARGGTAWYPQAVLGAPDPSARAGFGAALAFQGDTALVGAGGASVAGQAAVGAAYVFTRSGANWPLAAQLTDPGKTAGDRFGSAVALDGDKALVGAWGATVADKLEAGAAYVYGLGPSGWALRCPVTAAGPLSPDTLGWAVALDGETTLAGAPGDTVAGQSDAGAFFVHQLVRAPSLTLTAAPSVTTAGRRVSLSGAVTDLVAGAGTVRVWRRQGGTLSLLATVKTTALGGFACSVPVKKAGTWAFVATYDAGGRRFESPAVKVVVRPKPKPKPPDHKR